MNKELISKKITTVLFDTTMYVGLKAPETYNGKKLLQQRTNQPQGRYSVTGWYGDEVYSEDGFTVQQFEDICGFTPESGDHTGINGLHYDSYTFYINRKGQVGYRSNTQSYWHIGKDGRRATDENEANHSIFKKLPNMKNWEKVEFNGDECLVIHHRGGLFKNGKYIINIGEIKFKDKAEMIAYALTFA